MIYDISNTGKLIIEIEDDDFLKKNFVEIAEGIKAHRRVVEIVYYPHDINIDIKVTALMYYLIARHLVAMPGTVFYPNYSD